jgi:hypothetical protein
MAKINLFTSIYPESNKQRMAELTTCLEKNVAVFDEVFVLAEGDWQSYMPDCLNVSVLPITCRPTFKSFFNAVNAVSDAADINVIANSDIYFEDFPSLPVGDQCFALTRWDVKNGSPVFLNRLDSQDAWVFAGHIKVPNYCSFAIGRPGCDNRIARELAIAGYQITNPSLTIKSYHLHSGEKSYDVNTLRVPPPYMRLDPVKL